MFGSCLPSGECFYTKKKPHLPSQAFAYKVFRIINGKEIYGSQTCIFIYGPSTVNHKQPKAKEDNEILTFKDLLRQNNMCWKQGIIRCR